MNQQSEDLSKKTSDKSAKQKEVQAKVKAPMGIFDSSAKLVERAKAHSDKKENSAENPTNVSGGCSF